MQQCIALLFHLQLRKSGQPNLCLNVEATNGISGRGSWILIWSCANVDNEQFSFGFRMRAKHTDMCLEVANDEQLYQQECRQVSSQKFKPLALPFDTSGMLVGCAACQIGVKRLDG